VGDGRPRPSKRSEAPQDLSRGRGDAGSRLNLWPPISPATLAITHTMKITKLISLACLSCLPLASHAQVNDAVRALKILPAPKEVRMAEGRIMIKPSTTILISNSEDRTAAETLQKEIHDRTGIKLSIDFATAAPKTTGHISLGRLTDRGLRSYLESQGVKADELGSAI